MTKFIRCIVLLHIAWCVNFLFCGIVHAKGNVAPVVSDMLTHEDAIVVSSEVDVRVLPDWSYSYKLTRKIKLLSDKACREYGEIHIPYLKDSQKVSLIKGYTKTSSGKKIKAKKIYDYTTEHEMPLYGGMTLRVLSMAGLEKGCEITYSYKIKSKDLGTLRQFDDVYFLSETIPVEKATVSIGVPVNVSLYYATNNIADVPKIQDRGVKRYTWEMSNIDYLHMENHMPPIKSISTWIAVSTTNSWEDYIEKWRKIYQTSSSTSPGIKKFTKELTSDIEDEYGKAQHIFEYVRDKIRYLAIEFGRAGWVPATATKVFKDKAGDCKGKTVLVIAMLKSVGIDAYPVMLSARAEGPIIEAFCHDSQFNHILPICEISGNIIWMDPTGKAAFNELPYYYQGVNALVLKKDDGGFLKTPLSEMTDNMIIYTKYMQILRCRQMVALKAPLT